MTAERVQHLQPSSGPRTIPEFLTRIRSTTDPEIRSRLAWDCVLKNPSAVTHVARRAYGKADDDGRQDASLNLYRALLYTDPDRGSVFRVAHWFAMNGLQAQHGVHIPRNVAIKVVGALRHGHDLREADIGLCTAEERVRVAYLVGKFAHATLDATGSNSPIEDQTTRVNEEEHDLDRLAVALEKLRPIQRDALNLEDSLEAIGKRWGRSRERIRQIRAEALREVRKTVSLDTPLDRRREEEWRESLFWCAVPPSRLVAEAHRTRPI